MINPDKNTNLRVMSTPEWPVPYYQRSFRHPPSFERRTADLNYFGVPLKDTHVVLAKEYLKDSNMGYVVEVIENYFEIDSYKTKFEDSSAFSKAYVDDLLECLDVAFKENVRLLSEHDLADCLR